MTEEKKKCLVIGARGFTGVDSAEWTQPKASFPNVVDYELVVVDVGALATVLEKTNQEFFIEVRDKFSRFYKSGGALIVVAEPIRGVQNADGRKVNSWLWCPHAVELVEEKGSSVFRKPDHFKTYLSRLDQSRFYFRAARLLNDTGTVTHSYAQNREGLVLAGVYTSPASSGSMVLLPALENLDVRERISVVLQDLGITQTAAPPEWIAPIKVPGVDALKKQVTAIDTQVEQLNERRESLINEISGLNRYRALLYASGAELENIFRECLEKLGAKILDVTHGEEEFIAQFEGVDHVVECKGLGKSAGVDHVRQTIGHIMTYQQATNVRCHGILFVNAWRGLPISERNTADTVYFPANVIEWAKDGGIALVSSDTFFEAYCRFLQNPSVGARILKAIGSGRGVVQIGEEE